MRERVRLLITMLSLQTSIFGRLPMDVALALLLTRYVVYSQIHAYIQTCIRVRRAGITRMPTKCFPTYARGRSDDDDAAAAADEDEPEVKTGFLRPPLRGRFVELEELEWFE